MFSSGKVPHRPEDNLAMTALLPSVYLFIKVCAFEQNNSLAALEHVSISERLLIWWIKVVCLQLFTAFMRTCSPLMTNPHQPVRVCRCERCFFVPWGGQWQYSYGCISCTCSPPADRRVQSGVSAFVSHSHADLLSNVVFLIPVDRKLFSLPPFPGRPWQAYFLRCVCVCARCRFVCVDVCLCVYICVSTSVE